MQKLNLVKAIVTYRSAVSWNWNRKAKDRVDSARYLLLQKADTGKWDFVGGMVKEGETSRKAVMRKMMEDTGLEYLIAKQLPTVAQTDKNYNVRCDVYLINASSMSIQPSSEYSDYKWLRLKDVQGQDLVAYADLLLPFFNNPREYL